MVVFGVLLIVDTIRRHHIPPSLTPGILLALDLGQLSVFAVPVTWGVRVRRQGAAHKRLMLLSTIAILFPAVARWPFSFIRTFSQVGLIIDGFLLCMIVFDLLTRRRIHRVTIWGSLMIFVMVPAVFALGRAVFWVRFTEWCSNTINVWHMPMQRKRALPKPLSWYALLSETRLGLRFAVSAAMGIRAGTRTSY